MVAGDGVDVLTGGKGAGGPLGVVPAGADDPCARRQGRRIGSDGLLHGGEGWDVVEIDREALLAAAGHVGVGIVEAGHDEASREVDDLGVGAAESEDFSVSADGDDGGVGDSDGLDAGWDEAGVGCG